jgi:hypothetical protein
MVLKVDNQARNIMLIATLAGVYAVLRIIPTFPMIGVQGSRFSASDFVVPIYGIILTPYSSTVSIILGTLIAFFGGRPPIFYGLDFLPAVVNTLVIGFIVRRKRGYAALLYSILLVLFIGHPYTSILIQVTPLWTQNSFAVPFVWLHIVGLIILVSPVGSRLAWYIKKSSVRLMMIGFSLASLIGTLSQHLMGNLLYASIVLPPMLSEEARIASWTFIFWLYPIERIIIVILTTLVGVPIIRAINSSNQISLGDDN